MTFSGIAGGHLRKPWGAFHEEVFTVTGGFGCRDCAKHDGRPNCFRWQFWGIRGWAIGRHRWIVG